MPTLIHSNFLSFFQPFKSAFLILHICSLSNSSSLFLLLFLSSRFFSPSLSAVFLPYTVVFSIFFCPSRSLPFLLFSAYLSFIFFSFSSSLFLPLFRLVFPGFISTKYSNKKLCGSKPALVLFHLNALSDEESTKTCHADSKAPRPLFPRIVNHEGFGPRDSRLPEARR